MPPHRTIEGTSITAAGFERLLSRLDADADRAAAEYAHLRHALVQFFDWRGAWEADECADETLDRLAQKLQGDTAIDDVRRYAHGIARLVLLERLRRQARTSEVDVSRLANVREVPSAETNDLRDCFERCLAALSSESRALAIDYYLEQGGTKAAHRRRLAQAAGISDAALRSRVQRIRDGLEHCVRRCAAPAQSAPELRPTQHEPPTSDTLGVKGRR